MLLLDSSFVILECSVLILFFLELRLEELDLRILGLDFLLCYDKVLLRELCILYSLLVLFMLLKLHVRLFELIIFLLSDVRQSFAFEEQLLQIGCAIVVIAADLRGLGGIQAETLELLPIEDWSAVDLVKSLHELFVVMVTGETG